MRRILAWPLERAVKTAALAVVLAGLSCRPAGDPIRATLDSVAAAARGRNADKLLENVAADFQGADGSSRAEAESTLRRLFAAYEILDVELSEVTIEKSESATGPALARFTAKMTGQPRNVGGLAGFLPSASTWKFEARLVPSDGGGGPWKIAWARWVQVS
jgi:hypothetical protein